MSKHVTFDIKMRIDASENLHARLQKMTEEELTHFVVQNTFRNNCRELLNLNADLPQLWGTMMSNEWWVCENCGNKWSAMLGDNEVPERCECGGKIKENHDGRRWL